MKYLFYGKGLLSVLTLFPLVRLYAQSATLHVEGPFLVDTQYPKLKDYSAIMFELVNEPIGLYYNMERAKAIKR